MFGFGLIGLPLKSMTKNVIFFFFSVTKNLVIDETCCPTCGGTLAISNFFVATVEKDSSHSQSWSRTSENTQVQTHSEYSGDLNTDHLNTGNI